MVKALSEQSATDSVTYGIRPLYWDVPFDIVHFNWPESLFKWHAPSRREFRMMEVSLDRRRRHASFVTTVHNLDPHANVADGEKVLALVYSRTDQFVHLSEAAAQAFREKYESQAWCRRARHAVIPHGDYSYYKTIRESRGLVKTARRDGFGGRLILVMGTIRSIEEHDIAYQAFRLAAPERARLVFAGTPSPRLPPGTVAAWNKRKEKDVVRMHRRIDDKHVAALVKAASFVFIPRQGRLNSGVIPLAYTFGVPVIAPDDAGGGLAAVSADALRYRAGDAASAATAISRALQMRQSEYQALRKRIRRYAHEHMRWPQIARQHFELYRSLTMSAPVDGDYAKPKATLVGRMRSWLGRYLGVARA